MGNLTSQEITKIFLMLESKTRRKFQGDHTFSTKDTKLFKKMFQARYPTSVLIIEPERFNIGTYQIRFSDTDFESILVRRLELQYEKLKVIENNYNCVFRNITELNNKINNIKPENGIEIKQR
jgi:hypothetical protein